MEEISSYDKWTSRARPSFLYVMYVMILACIPMGILFAINPIAGVNIAKGMNLWLAAIPNTLWNVFGLCFSVYTLARTHEKQPLTGYK